MNIVLVGDSFSADSPDTSWVNLLSADHNVKNLSYCGISEYRIFQIIKKNLEIINESDLLLVFHTNPLRVFIPDGVDYPSRKFQTHVHCDMVANDALSSTRWKHIAETYYRNFYDDQMQKDFFDLLFKEIQHMVKVNILNFSGFAIESSSGIDCIDHIRFEHPGNINHMSDVGNKILYQYISEKITKCVY